MNEPRWLKATVKLTCHCTFDVPPATYFDWWPEKEVQCDPHGEQAVLRVSRLGTK